MSRQPCVYLLANGYLGAIYIDNGVFGFAYADLSTGEFRLTQAQDQQSLLDQLARN